MLTKEDVQLYLTQNYAYFISEYVERSKDRAFSYADLWALKENYLEELLTLIEKAKTFQSKNRFYRDDGFWVVAYEDNETMIWKT